jgi:hypothetical protein
VSVSRRPISEVGADIIGLAAGLGTGFLFIVVFAFAVWLLVAPTPECADGQVPVYAPSGIVCVVTGGAR